MSSLLTPDQKKALGPWLAVLVFIVSVAGGIAVYHAAGGAPIPVLSPLAPLVLGVVATLILLKQLSPKS